MCTHVSCSIGATSDTPGAGLSLWLRRKACTGLASLLSSSCAGRNLIPASQEWFLCSECLTNVACPLWEVHRANKSWGRGEAPTPQSFLRERTLVALFWHRAALLDVVPQEKHEPLFWTLVLVPAPLSRQAENPFPIKMKLAWIHPDDLSKEVTGDASWGKNRFCRPFYLKWKRKCKLCY